MKKIALLFTILCAGQLYGMEQLPKDIHHEIVRQAIKSSHTIEDAIKAVKVASALQGVKYDNLKDFTKLVHLLSDKLDETTEAIANKFDTSTAKTYVRLGKALEEALNNSLYRDVPLPDSINLVTQLIEQGADVNITFGPSGNRSTLLDKAVGAPMSTELIKLLVNAGAYTKYIKSELVEEAMKK